MAPEVLLPPAPSGQALPPVFQSQNFHTQTPISKPVQFFRQGFQETSNVPRIKGEKDFRTKQKQIIQNESPHFNSVTPANKLIHDGVNDQQEVIFLYRFNKRITL